MPLNEDSRDFIAKLSETEKTVMEFDKMLECLSADLHLIKNGYKLQFVADFHEVFRYLFPQFDHTIMVSESKFKIEQSILHYLFEKAPYKLLMLHRYFEEGEAFISSMRDDCEKVYRNYVVRQGQLNLESFAEEKNESKQDIPKEVKALISDFKASQDVQSALAIALDKLELLFADGKLFFINQRKEINNIDALDESSQGYIEILRKIMKERPNLDKYENNKTDSLAALAIIELTKKNIKNKQICLLISSSMAVEKVFLEIFMPLKTDEGESLTPIARNLTYILLKFYYSTKTLGEATVDIERVRNTIKQFIKEVTDVKKQSLSEPTPQLEQLQADILQTISLIESSLIKETNNGNWARLNMPSEQEISDLFSNSQELVALVQQAYTALTEAIIRLKQIKAVYGIS